MCVIEAGLHDATSSVYRRMPLTTTTLKDNLEIPGFDIVLPKTWELHGQVRILVYVKQSVRYQVIPTPATVSDIPTITLSASKWGERPS